MTVWQAIVLGIVQGLTEFMPISSSAHLILVPRLLGWADPGLSFSVALHIGTLVAVLIYFWFDLVQLAVAWLRSLRDRDFKDPYARLAWLLLLGTLPAAVAGFLLEEYAETVFRDLRVIGVTLILLAIILVIAERVTRGSKKLPDLSWQDSLWIGLAQALALVPGVSRSGATITAGLFRGLQRDAAARFSFLLSTPIVAAAGVQQFVQMARTGLPGNEQASFAAGMIASAIVGYLTIALLIRYLRRHSTLPFAAYRISLGILLLLLVTTGRLAPLA